MKLIIHQVSSNNCLHCASLEFGDSLSLVCHYPGFFFFITPYAIRLRHCLKNPADQSDPSEKAFSVIYIIDQGKSDEKSSEMLPHLRSLLDSHMHARYHTQEDYVLRRECVSEKIREYV